MADLTIKTIERPKLSRNKYGYTNNGQIIVGGSSYSGGGSGGGDSSGGGITYQDFTGATAVSNGSHGLVPAPGRGQHNYILHGNGSWRQLFGGHLQYDSETGTMIFDTSVQGTKAVFDDVSVLNTLDSLLIRSTTGNIKYINSSTNNTNIINASTGNIHDVNASTGNIKNINSSTGNINIINSNTGNIQELHSEDIFTKNLTVTGLAHFFELIIDRIRSAGGSILLTPADGFKVEKVVTVTNGYKLYWSAKDEDRAIYNQWLVNDQAISMSFNRAQVGVNYNISNKYYWSLVTGVGTETIDGDDYHYIIISSSVYDGEVNPEIGDEVVMLGSRNTQDLNRRNAIYLSAYNGLDTTLQAPFICQYKGINDFNLSNHKYTWFAANGNNIRGSLQIETGENVEDLVNIYGVEISSPLGNVFTTNETSTNLTAIITQSNLAVPENSSYYSNASFTWKKFDKDGNQITNWGTSGIKTGRTITVTKSEIDVKSTFTVDAEF